MNEREAGYVAGIIDGEGTISLTRRTVWTENAFQPRVSVANTDLRLLHYLIAVTGTGAVVGKRVREGRRIGYQWLCPSADVKSLLEAVRPSLVLKGEQADLVLEYISLRADAKAARKKGILPEDRGRLLELYQRLRELNQRGVDRPLEAGVVDRVSETAHKERRKTTTEQEASILALLYAGEMTALRIAEAVGVDRTVVRRLAREHGIETPYLSGEKHWTNQRAVTGEGLRPAECAHCGVRFETTHHKQKFCSPPCAEKAEQKKRVEKRREALGLGERECAVCGTPFKPARVNSRFCSRKCLMKDFRERQKEE